MNTKETVTHKFWQNLMKRNAKQSVRECLSGYKTTKNIHNAQIRLMFRNHTDTDIGILK